MIKRIILFLVLVVSVFACKEEETISVIPDKIQDKIDIFRNSCVYYGTKLTRYKWDSIYIYEFSIPVSSCYLCNNYYASGDSIVWNDEVDDSVYLADRTGAKVLWTFHNTDCEQ